MSTPTTRKAAHAVLSDAAANTPPDGAEVVSEAQALADLEYALHLARTGQRDPAFEERIARASERISQAVLSERGVVDVAVSLIREGRDEE